MVRRTRSVKIAPAFNGLKCEGPSKQEKNWQDTKHSEAGEFSFCKAGTANSNWSPCKGGMSRRVKTETICNHGGFYNVDKKMTRQCTKTGVRLNPGKLTTANTMTASDEFVCKKFAQKTGNQYMSFNKHVTVGVNCIVSNSPKTKAANSAWFFASTSCNLNFGYIQGGKNPSKIVMKYHQTKVCNKAGKPVADYSRFATRAERAGLADYSP
jgi:hypothetical protein